MLPWTVSSIIQESKTSRYSDERWFKIAVYATQTASTWGWRIFSGLIFGSLIAAILIVVSSLVALPLTYSTLEYNEEGLLYSKSVMAGLTVPQIYFSICTLACLIPLIGIALQAKLRFPALATKLSVSMAAPIAVAVVWFAYNSLVNYCGELLWMYHD